MLTRLKTRQPISPQLRDPAHFGEFCQYLLPYYQVDPVHALIGATLLRTLTGEITRLMIFAPPQHGKSLLVSTLFPVYFLGQRPDTPIIITSYGADLAEHHSRNARMFLESPEYQNVFPQIHTDLASRARDHWNLSPPNRGRVLAVGVGGPITGFGAMCVTGNTLIATELGAFPAAELAGFTTFPKIWAFDEVSEQLVLAEIQAIQRSLRADITCLTTQHGRKLVTTTDHPIYVLGQGYLAAGLLRPGMPLLTRNDVADAVDSVATLHPGGRPVYDIQVAKQHNFFAEGILVHNCAIIDDPFENWEQAQNARERERVWDWYRGTFRTRVQEGGAVILISTRWHEDDLAGRLLNESESTTWTVLRLPALAETQAERDDNNRRIGLPQGEADPLNRQPGEALAPQRFSVATLLDIQDDVGPLVWGAEYQGAPRAMLGNRLKRAWLDHFVAALPTGCTYVRYWDKAGTAGGGAYTSGVLLAQTPTDPKQPSVKHWYIVDVVRGQWSAGERNAVIRQTAELDTQQYGMDLQVWVEQEPGSGGKESAEISVMDLAGYIVHVDRVTGSKDVRMEPLAAQMEVGNVSLMRGKWNADLIDELCALPNGKWRDSADASSGAFNKLALAAGRRKPAGAWGRKQ